MSLDLSSIRMTLEHMISFVWYRIHIDFGFGPDDIMLWESSDAMLDFKRDLGDYSCEDTSEQDRIKVAIEDTEMLIQNNMAIALTSSSPYVREYAKLLNKKMEKDVS